MPRRTSRAGPGGPELLESCCPSLISSGRNQKADFILSSWRCFSQDPRSKGLSPLAQSREGTLMVLTWVMFSPISQSLCLGVNTRQPRLGSTVPNPGPLLETWKGDQDSGTITKVTTGPTRDYPSLDVVCGCFGQHENTWSWKPCSCVNPRKFLKLYKPWCPHIKVRVIISLSLVCFD